jgi:hypothetical protein
MFLYSEHQRLGRQQVTSVQTARTTLTVSFQQMSSLQNHPRPSTHFEPEFQSHLARQRQVYLAPSTPAHPRLRRNYPVASVHRPLPRQLRLRKPYVDVNSLTLRPLK